VKSIKNIFKKMPTHCKPWCVDRTTAKILEIDFNDTLKSRPWAIFQWSCKGKGFGEFSFRTLEDGKIICSNEMESKEFIKLMLFKMVDDCVLEDKPRSA
jgi:hypothetical protein